jgi:lipoprotein-anchoring transpeptidase ErfK/SrfK
VTTTPVRTAPNARGAAARRRRLAALTLCAVAGLLATACSAGSTTSAGHSGTSHSHGSKAKTTASNGLTISPGTGSQDTQPGQGITVTSAHGRISQVSVHAAAGADPVTGSLNSAGTTWHSRWALDVATKYTVTATATENGKHVTDTSTFSTLKPASTAQVEIFEGYHQTFGVGMPIMLTFSHPVTNKAAVERSLQITSSKPVVGAWAWDGNSSLNFRPRTYWPANTQVSFTGHLNGIEFAPGVYGAHTLTQSFSIGQSLIVVASTTSHYMKLYRGGHLYAHWPVSTGRTGDNTPNGTYLTIDKGNPVLMKGPGYKLEVPWSVRFTWTGDYLHDAYWSVDEQGFTNVSHGCVNMRPADAETYYKMEVPGDPVTVVGSPKAGEWDNGWTEWFRTWSQFLAGSALHQAVEAGPDGSKFVNPSALPASNGSAPLNQPWPNNWASD